MLETEVPFVALDFRNLQGARGLSTRRGSTSTRYGTNPGDADVYRVLILDMEWDCAAMLDLPFRFENGRDGVHIVQIGRVVLSDSGSDRKKLTLRPQ